MGNALFGGCEAGWLNPMVGKEYAIDEIQQVVNCFRKSWSLIIIKFILKAHHDIIHVKGATGKLVVKLTEG